MRIVPNERIPSAYRPLIVSDERSPSAYRGPCWGAFGSCGSLGPGGACWDPVGRRWVLLGRDEASLEPIWFGSGEI